jgi:hypothetical protein
MELQKRNETIWSVKRTAKPGRFLLRAVEEAGEYIEFSLGLELEGQKIMFDVDRDEFLNFYNILTSFKGLLEGNPAGFSQMASKASGWSKNPEKAPARPAPFKQMSLDGGDVPEEMVQESYASLQDLPITDKGLESLEELDDTEIFATELESALQEIDAQPQIPPPTPLPTPIPIIPPEPSPKPSGVVINDISARPPKTGPIAEPVSLAQEDQEIPQEMVDELHAVPDASDEELKAEESEDLLSQITDLASKLQTIPESKPVVPGVSVPFFPSTKISVPKVEIPAPKGESESQPFKKKELKESDWDPW